MSNQWTRYQKLVLTELARHSKSLDALENKLVKIEIEVATLRARAGIWGALAGTAATLSVIFFELLKK